MKRGKVLLLLFFVFLLLQVIFVSAAENDTEQAKVSKAYSCLQDKTSGKCDTLSVQEKTFTVLATNQCRTELVADSQNSGECWGSSSTSACRVKETAQAMLALRTNSQATQDWLYAQHAVPTDLTWYLEIESDSATACTISYGTSSYVVNVDENKQIDTNAGSCLILDSDRYWLTVSQSCYGTEFTVSCNQDFLTTTLFRKQNSGTIHVSSETSSAAAGGSTAETINSFCFAESGSCSYEGTLWAALALDAAGKDASAYLPYLITLAGDNQRYLPDAFLYQLTANDDYKLSLLSQQKSNQYWQESGDRYYDTALALYPLKQDTSQAKTNSKTWLLNTQDSNGCWENNIRNTAFVLASVWPRTFTGGGGGGTTLPDCETQGKFCTSSAECTASGGNLLDSSYSCPGFSQKCCSVQPTVKTCSELGGEVCSSNERCVGGSTPGAADLRTGEICCASGGYCSVVTPSTGGDGTGGTGGTGTTEPPPTTGGGSTLWIWILLILIVLVVIGILFRHKLRMLWFRMSNRGRAPSHTLGPRPPFLPPAIQRPIQRIERRILMPQPQHHPVQGPVAKARTGAEKELDEVLKKLKEMGK